MFVDIQAWKAPVRTFESVMQAECTTMLPPDRKPAHQSSSVLQRTVTLLPRVKPVSLLEALSCDVDLGQPETVEDRLGRTLKDMLCTP